MTRDNPEILELLRQYLVGLHRCDTDLLKAVFHEKAIYFTASGGEVLHHDMETYLPKVAARTPPKDLGEPLTYHVDRIEMAGPDTAFARVRSSMWGKDFIDLLTLARINDEWRIVSKVFHHEDQRDAKTGATWN